MSVKLRHEALTKAHDFSVALSARVKVGTALCTADRQTGETVFEGLLKAEELHFSHVYRRMKAQAALIRTDCSVELNSVSAVDANLALVINPCYAERDCPFRLSHSFKQSRLFKFRVLVDIGLD